MSKRMRNLGVGRAWADLPLRAKGLVVVAIPLLAMLLATVLFGVALAQDRRAARQERTPTGCPAATRSGSWDADWSGPAPPPPTSRW
jgi:hypothetical protein